ncbi:Guanosine-diphosphatase [Collariella sp. IMI 366227]|nr:Guanosine-diphosphatase [Collariella sp. IMI 366227]
MRRTSVSLPTKHFAHDPHEKPDRYGNNRNQSLFTKMQSSWASQSQRARYIKTGAIIFVVFLLFYFFSPTGVDLYHKEAPSSKSSTKGNQGQTPSDGSYGTDRCSRSFSKDKPIVQYVLMIDAGSTGSRIHVYKFNNCGAAPELEGEVLFKQTEKIEGKSSGLSAYKDDPKAAAESLDPLLEAAKNVVPDKLKACSPIALKATAGLRLIGEEKSNKILEAVRQRLETIYPFPVVSREENGVATMDGSDEGVYAWITTNYLLGKIGGPDHSETAAVFDLGGGSTQIVFQPSFEGLTSGGMPDKLAEGDHKYELDFGGRKFNLYQHSHLGYGLMSAREAIHATLRTKPPPDAAWTRQPVIHPCFNAGMSKTVKVKLSTDHPLGPELELNMTGPSTAAPAQCRSLAERILKKDASCALAPCSFNGVHQPAIAKTFAREDVFFLSYFFDRTQVLGMPESFTLREMSDLAKRVCGGEKGDNGSNWDVFSSIPKALEELKGRPEHCLDLNFMVALTHTGYEMPLDREVRIAKQLKDNELGWCLGASLPLLSKASGWKCKVTEIH